MPGTYHIALAEGAIPVAHPPRNVPLLQREKVIQELKRMERLGVIVRQDKPTEWVDQKPGGTVRLCIVLRDLNKVINNGQLKKTSI